jgi:hypothetical protein
MLILIADSLLLGLLSLRRFRASQWIQDGQTT